MHRFELQRSVSAASSTLDTHDDTPQHKVHMCHSIILLHSVFFFREEVGQEGISTCQPNREGTASTYYSSLLCQCLCCCVRMIKQQGRGEGATSIPDEVHHENKVCC